MSNFLAGQLMECKLMKRFATLPASILSRYSGTAGNKFAASVLSPKLFAINGGAASRANNLMMVMIVCITKIIEENGK